MVVVVQAAGGVPRGDSSWDALFSSGGQLVDGYTAELAIPFKSLRYPGPRPGYRIHGG